MSNTTRWVHGSVVQVEADPQSVEVIRRGWGTHILMRDSNAEYWVHFPIPTQATIDGVQFSLSGAYVLFSTDGTEVRTVHVYDGLKIIKAFDDLHLEGDYSLAVGAQNSWDVDPPIKIAQAIGISVSIKVLQGGRWGFPEILITGAGAEFESP